MGSTSRQPAARKARRRATCAAWAVLVTSLCGCAAAPAPAPQQPSAPQRPVASDPDTALERELSQVEDRGSPLAVLGAITRTALETELASLSEEERKQLQSRRELALARPLLHLAAVGVLPEAYQQLSAGSAAADEIVAAHFSRAEHDLSGVIEEVTQVAELAARRVVRDELSARAGSGPFEVPQLKALATALYTLQDWPLCQRVLERLLQRRPGPDVALQLALVKAQRGDFVAAEAALISDQKSTPHELQAAIAQTRAALGVVQRAADAQSPPERVALARAALALGLPEVARQGVQPLLEQSASNLALAVLQVQSQLGSDLCPGVRPGLGNEALCAAAWRVWPGRVEAQALLEHAWQSGQGRDPKSVEDALGLRFVVPMMQTPDPTDASSTKARREHMAAFAAALSDVAALAPRLSALHLFAEVVTRAVGAEGPIPPKQLQVWRSQALESLQHSPADGAAQAAALGLATWLAPSQNIADLIDAVSPADVAQTDLLGVWIKLNASVALVEGDAERLQQGLAELPRWLRDSPSPLLHGQMLFLLSQAELALAPDAANKWATVGHLSQSLVPMPQARLQQAAVLAHAGDGAGALAQLDTLTGELNAASVDLPEFSVVLRAMQLGLRALGKQGPERTALQNELDALAREVTQASHPSPPAVKLWTQLWARRVRLTDTQLKEAQCSAVLCADVVLKRNPALRRQVDARTLQLLQRGVLSTGRVGLSWGYAVNSGLQPVIWVEPSWLVLP